MAIDRVYVEGDYVQFRDSAGDFVSAIHYSEFSYANDNGDILFIHRRDEAAIYPITRVNFLDVKDASGTPYVTSPDTLDDFLTVFIALLPTVGGGGGGGTAPDIATYSIGVDTTANNAWVRILTIFNPVTNVPTRSFFQLDGTTTYTPSTTAAAIIDAEGLLKDVYTATNTSAIYAEVIERRLANIMTATGIADNTPSSDPQPTATFTQTVVEAPLGGGDIPFNTTAGARHLQIIALSGTFSMSGISGTITYPLATAGGGLISSFNLEAPFGKALPAIGFNVVDGSSVLLIELSANL